MNAVVVAGRDSLVNLIAGTAEQRNRDDLSNVVARTARPGSEALAGARCVR